MTRFRLFIVSVLRFRGLALPWSLRKRPQALQRVAPSSLRRQRGVVEVPQFWQTGGFPPTARCVAPFAVGEPVDCLLLSGASSAPFCESLRSEPAGHRGSPFAVAVLAATIIESPGGLAYVMNVAESRTSAVMESIFSQHMLFHTLVVVLGFEGEI